MIQHGKDDSMDALPATRFRSSVWLLVCIVGNKLSVTIVLNTGVPQGCVLTPLLFTLITHDCCAIFNSNHGFKFTADTTVVGFIRLVYRAYHCWLVVDHKFHLLGQESSAASTLLVPVNYNTNSVAISVKLQAKKSLRLCLTCKAAVV